MSKDQHRSTDSATTDRPEAPLGPSSAETLHAAVQEAKALLLALESTAATRVAVRMGEFEIEIERGPMAAAPGVSATAIPASHGAEIKAPEAKASLVAISAPLVGIFYRAAAPGGKPFVEVGQQVVPGQQVGIIEAMKIMNEVVSEVHGSVTEILMADGTPVVYEQPLMLIDTSDTRSNGDTGGL